MVNNKLVVTKRNRIWVLLLLLLLLLLMLLLLLLRVLVHPGAITRQQLRVPQMAPTSTSTTAVLESLKPWPYPWVYVLVV
jgi:hypothetical protein